MFLLIGFLAYHTGMTAGLFEAAKARLPGGLAISSILACSGFAAMSGSSLACAAAMGRIAIPEMGAAGCIAAGGTIGALVPPSILMIIYGIIAEPSVTQVFLGGITIGLLTAVSYCVVVLVIAFARPGIIPPSAPVTRGDAGAALRQTAPILVLILLVIVLVYLALGAFMEPFGAMLVTLPVFLPLIEAQGLCLVWFGVLVVKLLEIGMITPPVGLNALVIKNVASRHVSVSQVFAGVVPFLLADLVVVALLIAAPVVRFLPGLLG